MLSDETDAVLGECGVGLIDDLGDQGVLLPRGEQSGTAGYGPGPKVLTLATALAPPAEGAGTDAHGAGDLGRRVAGVDGLEQPLTEIAGARGGHAFSLPQTVNLTTPRSESVNRTNGHCLP
ncbi:MAG: hypothetical protein AVDCRST_MAG33-3250 [uncultured Thermomicrobiales bacterium]|uniref:Uncharacterized protein n=1 Tax=uncultured Thermomicrobiales bacterium TaxID=1645740 RepID=A0A6J4VH05_9BACT|nr:MAG: hypothetical protein AVDCRST_MAG33-3250 [uncultured Thermomicrobiales bacterium]